MGYVRGIQIDALARLTTNLETEMFESFENAKDELHHSGLAYTNNALLPLQRIDFDKLVEVYDHEAVFLRDTFFKSLKEAHDARIKTSGGIRKVNHNDVRTAMLMLGTAVANAEESKFSKKSKSIIADVCPYC